MVILALHSFLFVFSLIITGTTGQVNDMGFLNTRKVKEENRMRKVRYSHIELVEL